MPHVPRSIMDRFTIGDRNNVAGMSLLLDTSGAPQDFDPRALEDQIRGGAEGEVARRDGAIDLEGELARITAGSSYTNAVGAPHARDAVGGFGAEFDAPTDLDELMRRVDDLGADSGMPVATAPMRAVPAPIFHDPHLQYATNEERRQAVIGEVFQDLHEGAAPMVDTQVERDEDEKARLIEHIASLRSALEDDNEDLSGVPTVSPASSLSEINTSLKILLYKNDRKRCCSVAEEIAMIAALGVESAFDGKKSYFGYSPDMTDWGRSVQQKLRRMRADTANVVGGIIKQYGMGSITRIALELLPSMFLYSRMRKAQHQDTIANEANFSDGLNKLRDYRQS